MKALKIATDRRMTKKRTFSIGPGVACDIDRLISTRLLVQANSGGGKSFTLRRLLEQTHGAVQQIVLDPEGEFASLRESFDYVLAARQGGDTLADPRTAKLLAERLLELGVSAILDIYELNPNERIRFVRLFLEALVDAPKHLWHPVLVVIDEAHVYCPEKDQAESSAAVKALCSRGRKRGFCAVLATQRLSKLAKDAAAECNNKLIGRTSLDVDMARAGDELGFTKADRLVLRDLEDGEFFAFGPAMTKTVTRVKVGAVKTRHPEAGSKLAAVVPPPTEKVKALLPKLSDLPAEAEAREKTVDGLKKELATVRRELTEVRRAQPPAPKDVEKRVEVLTDADRALLGRLFGKVESIGHDILSCFNASSHHLERDLESAIKNFHANRGDGADRAFRAMEESLKSKGFEKILGKLSALSPQPAIRNPQSQMPHRQAERTTPARPQERPAGAVSPGGSRNQPRPAGGDGPLAPGERRILTAVAQFGEVDRGQLTVLVGYKATARDTYISRLAQKGFVESGQGRVRVLQAGIDALGADYEPLPTGDALLAYWRGRLAPGECKVLDAVVAVYPESTARSVIGDQTGYKPTARDTYISRLASRRLLKSDGRGSVRASEELFS